MTESRGPATLLCVDGEVDAGNCDTWRHALTAAAAAATAAGPLVVDLRRLDFMAICGYCALADTARACQHRTVSLWLVSDRPIVKKAVAICGFSELLPIATTVEDVIGPDSDPPRCRG